MGRKSLNIVLTVTYCLYLLPKTTKRTAEQNTSCRDKTETPSLEDGGTFRLWDCEAHFFWGGLT